MKILGRPLAELIGQTIRSFIHEDDTGEALTHRTRVLAGGQTAPGVRRIVRPDGTVRWIEVTATNLLDHPAVGAIVSNVRDITDRKLAEDALVASIGGSSRRPTGRRQPPRRAPTFDGRATPRHARRSISTRTARACRCSSASPLSRATK